MASKTRSIRASEEEWASWDKAAGSMKFNAWAKLAFNDAAAVPVDNRVEAPLPRSKKKDPLGCKHEGYEKFMYCYSCGGRV